MTNFSFLLHFKYSFFPECIYIVFKFLVLSYIFPKFDIYYILYFLNLSTNVKGCGFVEAFSTEPFPFVSMDEPILTYLLAALAFKLDHKSECKQYLATVITHTNCPPRIKERALDSKAKLND